MNLANLVLKKARAVGHRPVDSLTTEPVSVVDRGAVNPEVQVTVVGPKRTVAVNGRGTAVELGAGSGRGRSDQRTFLRSPAEPLCAAMRPTRWHSRISAGRSRAIDLAVEAPIAAAARTGAHQGAGSPASGPESQQCPQPSIGVHAVQLARTRFEAPLEFRSQWLSTSGGRQARFTLRIEPCLQNRILNVAPSSGAGSKESSRSLLPPESSTRNSPSAIAPA